MTLPLHAFKMAPVMYTIYGFAIYFFFFWCGKWGVHLIAIFYGKWRLHKKISQVPCETPFPGVSILKPLMGVDPNLFGNLETFFTMNYPVYELLFCVEDESDPAIMLVKRLMEKYPKVSARLFTGGVTVGVNPKINNMQPGFLAAKYELILISDSGIRMKEDTLLDMVSYLKDDVGLVHQMPFTCDRDGFAATLEKIYFGTAQARIYLAAAFLGVNCHTGCLHPAEIQDRLVFQKKVAKLRGKPEKQLAKLWNISMEEQQRRSLRLRNHWRACKERRVSLRTKHVV